MITTTNEFVRYAWCIRDADPNKWVSGLKVWDNTNKAFVMGAKPTDPTDPCYYQDETILDGRIIGMSGTTDNGVDTIGFVVDDSVCGTADDPFSLTAVTQSLQPLSGYISTNLLTNGGTQIAVSTSTLVAEETYKLTYIKEWRNGEGRLVGMHFSWQSKVTFCKKAKSWGSQLGTVTKHNISYDREVVNVFIYSDWTKTGAGSSVQYIELELDDGLKVKVGTETAAATTARADAVAGTIASGALFETMVGVGRFVGL